jgi:hypothetical protein
LDARFRARQNSFVTYVDGHLADLGLAAGDPPPSDPGELKFLLLSSRMPGVAQFTGRDAGKAAHPMLRWRSTRGEVARCSETASATIGA